MRRVLILNVLLLAIILGLVVQIASLWWRAEAEDDSVAPREAKAQRPEPPPAPRRPPAPDLANKIAEKDLFDASRSAEKAPAVAAAEAPPPPPLNVQLLGVTVAAGAREALLKDQNQPKPLWMREGEDVSGYTITRIDPISVEMRTPTGEQVTVGITVEKGAHPGAPALGPAGVQPTPAAVQVGRGRPTPQAPQHAGAPTPNDIKEKIERLREEARKRRQQRQQAQ
ncbi:MAG TPA: hypothetical protein VGK30_01465 [Candidatus Binatia bacterium]|jgi:hypothetical protein